MTAVTVQHDWQLNVGRQRH